MESSERSYEVATQPLDFIWDLESKQKYNVFLNELNDILRFWDRPSEQSRIGMDRRELTPEQQKKLEFLQSRSRASQTAQTSSFRTPGPSRPNFTPKQLVDIVDEEESNLLYLSPHLQMIHDMLGMNMVHIEWTGTDNPENLLEEDPVRFGSLMSETLHYGNLDRKQLEMTAIVFIAHIIGDIERKGILLQQKYVKTLEHAERARMIVDDYGVLVVFRHEEVYYSFPLGKQQIPNEWLYKAYFVCWLADQITFVNHPPPQLPTFSDLLTYQHPLKMFMVSLQDIINPNEESPKFDVKQAQLLFKLQDADRNVKVVEDEIRLFRFIGYGSQFEISEFKKIPNWRLVLSRNQEGKATKLINLSNELPLLNKLYLLSRLAWFGHFPQNFDQPFVVQPSFYNRLKLSYWMTFVKYWIFQFPLRLPMQYCGKEIVIKGLQTIRNLAFSPIPEPQFCSVLFIPWTFPRQYQPIKNAPVEWSPNPASREEQYDFRDNLLDIKIDDDLPLCFQRFWNQNQFYLRPETNNTLPFLHSLAQASEIKVLKQSKLSQRLSFESSPPPHLNFVRAPVQVIIGSHRFYLDPLFFLKTSPKNDLMIKLLCRMSSWHFLKPYDPRFSTMYQTIELTDKEDIDLFYTMILPLRAKKRMTALVRI